VAAPSLAYRRLAGAMLLDVTVAAGHDLRLSDSLE
jgi:hypothetical protein